MTTASETERESRMKVRVTLGRESQGGKGTPIVARLVMTSETERESQGGAREALNKRKGHERKKESRMEERVTNERESHMREKVMIQRRSPG